jgi:DNA-binding CsgD family transcriptional regulator
MRDAALVDTARAIVTLEGEILFITGNALRLLRRYYDDATAFAVPAQLVPLLRSLKSGVARTVISRPGEELMMECVTHIEAAVPMAMNATGEATAERKLVVLHFTERTIATATLRLKALGLTQREAEILAWMAFGKGNNEISVICEVSVRTVNKHCEHLFTKLGVESRTAAICVAWSHFAFR